MLIEILSDTVCNLSLSASDAVDSSTPSVTSLMIVLSLPLNAEIDTVSDKVLTNPLAKIVPSDTFIDSLISFTSSLNDVLNV